MPPANHYEKNCTTNRLYDCPPRNNFTHFNRLQTLTTGTWARTPLTSYFFLSMAHAGDSVLILDFGAQYTQLIARRVRELGVYAEIYPCTAPMKEIEAYAPKAIILSGGPASVYAPDAPHCSPEVFKMGVPILGICYGLQMIAYEMGGEVDKSAKREYGRAEIEITDKTCKL